MYKSRLHKSIKILCLFLCMAVLAACVSPKAEETASRPQTGLVKIAPGAYDSADTAIVIAKQEKQKENYLFKFEKEKKLYLEL